MIEYAITELPPPPGDLTPALRQRVGPSSRWRAFLRGAAYTNPVRDVLARWRGVHEATNFPNAAGSEPEFTTLRIGPIGFELLRRDGKVISLPLAYLDEVYFVEVSIYRHWDVREDEIYFEEVYLRRADRRYRLVVRQPPAYEDYVRAVAGRLMDLALLRDEDGSSQTTYRGKAYREFTFRDTYRTRLRPPPYAGQRIEDQYHDGLATVIKVPVSPEMGEEAAATFELWGSRAGLRVVRSGETVVKLSYPSIAHFQFNGCIYFRPAHLLRSRQSSMLTYSELLIEIKDGTPYTFYISDRSYAEAQRLKRSLEGWMNGAFLEPPPGEAIQASLKLRQGAAVTRSVEQFRSNHEKH